MGYGLLDIGAQTRQQGMMGLRDAANREQEVEMANQSLRTAKKQQTMSAVGTGAAVGSTVLPGIGTAIGAGIGFLADSLF
ncbi:bacteriocin [Aeromonas veronii]|uniref:bacteriocin n=1 Tax=Aeromonas TaxID=642 RepID=UPI000B599B8B|nr:MULTISPECIES: bacteriocin [Aeromonas]MBL0637913.1 bacteriocin [Aeromonas veronii]MCF5881770.1 bacteriocin [Aeromonas veronii]MCQ4110492.1 bacteriocin [Aeromonas sp. JL9]QGW97798.1 bacteriocin [Aeromonas veronii]